MANRVVVITGADGGIGSATTRLFARTENSIALVYHPLRWQYVNALSTDLNMLRPGFVKSTPFANDVANYQNVVICVGNIIERFGRIDVLVNAAGIPQIPSVLIKTDLEKVRKIMDVNLWGTLHWCKAVLPYMRSQNYGRIINTASIAALGGDAGNAIYAASKAGIANFTKSFALEAPFNKDGDPHDITVNAVAPGLTDTDMAKVLTDTMHEIYKRGNPFHRLCRPEEIAEVIYFLANAPQALTGEVIRVDCGFKA